MKHLITILISLLAGVHLLSAQNFYDINAIQKIEITFSQSNWDYMMDTATVGGDSYIMAKTVAVNGVLFDSVGVKYKGNSTYNVNQKKNPLHIELDAFKDQDYQGYTDIKMSNVAKDPSFVREVLSYNILRQYMDAPLSNYANVYINGTLIGLYVSSESISKKFVNKHFYSKDKPFFKCNPVAGAGPGSSAKPNLVHLGTDSTKYYAAYEMKSGYGWKHLIGLCDTLKTNITAIEKVLDVDRAIWMLAFDNLFVNLDSYIGGFAQNYYLYQDDAGRFNPVVWDLNESFGTFSQTGNGNLQGTAAKQNMTHLLHINDAAWPLVQKLLSIPRYKRMYIAHMKTMLSENFSSGTYFSAAQNLQSIINNAVNADPNKFYSYAQYQSNLTSDVTGGMSGTPGIKSLMDGRNTFLSAQAEFTAIPPAISNIALSESSPALKKPVTITLRANNATEVYIGYRFSPKSPFTKLKMYDDGNHGDGAAADQIYGASFVMADVFVQYYFYAENNNAGIFSPARAEHEFYSANAKITTLKKGDLVINEFMADNAGTVADANDQYDDWIELYNNTDNILSLENLYLSDNYNSPLKWKFPETATIAPKAYLVVWADEDGSQEGHHASFKLSSGGEKLMLSYPDGTVVDSIAFGAQTTDVSMSRCPNGSGSFRAGSPTFEKENCPAMPYLTVGADTLHIGAPENDLVSFDILSNVSWNISSDQNWLQTELVSGTGNANVHLNAALNASLTSRIAHLSISPSGLSPKTVVVVQAGALPFVEVSEDTLYLPHENSSAAVVEVSANVSWEVSIDEGWLTANLYQGNGNTTLNLTAEENGSEQARSALVSVTGSGITKSVVVVQDRVTGVVNEPDELPFTIYPNPANGRIYILPYTSQMNEISISGMNGQVFMRETNVNLSSGVEISHLPAGVYHVTMIVGKHSEMVHCKLVKY